MARFTLEGKKWAVLTDGIFVLAPLALCFMAPAPWIYGLIASLLIAVLLTGTRVLKLPPRVEFPVYAVLYLALIVALCCIRLKWIFIGR